MKSTITLGLMMAALFLSTSTSAQVKEARFGHIDTQALLESMPERNTIQSEIEGAAAQYEQEIVRMQGELEAKVAALEGLFARVGRLEELELHAARARGMPGPSSSVGFGERPPTSPTSPTSGAPREPPREAPPLSSLGLPVSSPTLPANKSPKVLSTEGVRVQAMEIL